MITSLKYNYIKNVKGNLLKMTSTNLTLGEGISEHSIYSINKIVPIAFRQ